MRLSARAVVASGITILILGAGYQFKEKRERDLNMKVCRDLVPGITFSDLVKKIGMPAETWFEKGERWISFKVPGFLAGEIKAQVSESSGRIMVLQCVDGRPPFWTLVKGESSSNQ